MPKLLSLHGKVSVFATSLAGLMLARKVREDMLKILVKAYYKAQQRPIGQRLAALWLLAREITPLDDRFTTK
jgi:hypothetical protein